MFEIKKGDLLFYNNSSVVEIGIVTNIALDGWVTVINNCTKQNVPPLNFIEVTKNYSDQLRKSIETFKY